MFFKPKKKNPVVKRTKTIHPSRTSSLDYCDDYVVDRVLDSAFGTTDYTSVDSDTGSDCGSDD